jgi:nitric oxide reductase activation protein
VQFQEVKAFRDRVDLAVRCRLGGLRPSGYTRLGAAIRHGGAILEQRSGAPRRLLIVISDGFAYDHGYEGAYGEADARRALSEARRAGTACVCLSIAARTESDALARVFGTAAYARLPRAELPPVLVGALFSSALKTAEAKRRTSDRRRRSHEQRQRSFS